MEDIENRAGERGEERIKKGKRHKWIHLCLLLTKKTDTRYRVSVLEKQERHEWIHLCLLLTKKTDVRYRVSVLEKQERQKWIHLCLLLMKKTDARYRVSVLRNQKASYYMSELEYEHRASLLITRTSQHSLVQIHDLTAEGKTDA